MTDERLKIWLGFGKFVLGTVVIGLVAHFINYEIQNRKVELKEAELRREIELKETEQLGKFIQHDSSGESSLGFDGDRTCLNQ